MCDFLRGRSFCLFPFQPDLSAARKEGRWEHAATYRNTQHSGAPRRRAVRGTRGAAPSSSPPRRSPGRATLRGRIISVMCCFSPPTFGFIPLNSDFFLQFGFSPPVWIFFLFLFYFIFFSMPARQRFPALGNAHRADKRTEREEGGGTIQQPQTKSRPEPHTFFIFSF